MIAESRELVPQEISVISKDWVEETPHVLDHDGFGFAFVDDPDCMGKQVSFVLVPQLLTGNGKRGTRQAAGKQVNALVVGGIETRYVGLRAILHIPFWAVVTQSGLAELIDLDCGAMRKPGQFKPKCLTARAGAEFNGIHK